MVEKPCTAGVWGWRSWEKSCVLQEPAKAHQNSEVKTLFLLQCFSSTLYWQSLSASEERKIILRAYIHFSKSRQKRVIWNWQAVHQISEKFQLFSLWSTSLNRVSNNPRVLFFSSFSLTKISAYVMLKKILLPFGSQCQNNFHWFRCSSLSLLFHTALNFYDFLSAL